MRVLLALLVLASVCGTTLACNCRNSTDRMKYCYANVAVEIKVNTNLKIGGPRHDREAYYKIKVKSVWKLPDGVEQKVLENKKKLYSDSGAQCGVLDLKKGQKYLVTGTYKSSNGRLWIDLCDSLRTKAPEYNPLKEWKNTPPDCQQVSSTSSTSSIFYDDWSVLYGR